jgi:hypothetical protein
VQVRPRRKSDCPVHRHLRAFQVGNGTPSVTEAARSRPGSTPDPRRTGSGPGVGPGVDQLPPRMRRSRIRGGESKAGWHLGGALPVQRRRLRDVRRARMRPSVVRTAVARAAAEGSGMGMKVTLAKVSSGRNLEAEKQ